MKRTSGWGDRAITSEFQSWGSVAFSFQYVVGRPEHTSHGNAGWDGLVAFETIFGSPDLDVVAGLHLRSELDYFTCSCADEDERTLRVREAVAMCPKPLILYSSLRS